MAINLITNPVETVGTQVRNLFAGFNPVKFVFKREDQSIILVEQGTGNDIKINYGIDLSSYLEAGDWVYLYAEGENGVYTYDDVYQVTIVGSTYIEVDGEFIEQSTSGYINYKQNYYLECEIVDPDNSDIKIIPFTLRDDGDQAGNITIDVSIINDLNVQYFPDATENMDDSAIKFKVRYRENYKDNTGTYIAIDDAVILIYATEQPDIDELLNDLTLPEVYIGYPSGVTLSHSDENQDESGLKIVYDELDRNRAEINTNNLLKFFPAATYGLYFVEISTTVLAGLTANTEYIKIKAEFANQPEYEPTEYDNTDYKTY